MLEAEAERLCNAGRYERTEARRDTCAGSYPLLPERRPRVGPLSFFPILEPLGGASRAVLFWQEGPLNIRSDISSFPFVFNTGTKLVNVRNPLKSWPHPPPLNQRVTGSNHEVSVWSLGVTKIEIPWCGAN